MRRNKKNQTAEYTVTDGNILEVKDLRVNIKVDDY